MAAPRQTHHEPIVLAARYSVVCEPCGFAYDSAAATPEAAVAGIAATHRHPGCAFDVYPMDYDTHPLFEGVPKWKRKPKSRA